MTPPDPLDALLTQWRVPTEPPANLAHHVWTRIESGAADVPWWEKCAMQLLTPRGVAWGCAAAVAIGCAFAVLNPPGRAADPQTAYVRAVSSFSPGH